MLIVNYFKSIDYEKGNSYVRGSGCGLRLWSGKEIRCGQVIDRRLGNRGGGLATEGGFEKATISFDEKEVHGNTSINNFFGDYTVKGDAIKFGELGVTKMMGPTPEVEAAVLEGLDAAAKVQVTDDDNVSILSEDGTTVLKLKRKLILIEEQA